MLPNLNNNVYRLLEKDNALFQSPFFIVKHLRAFIPGLSYKKIIDWGNQGFLINFLEDKDRFNPKFSILDSLKLRVVSDLKHSGFNAGKNKLFLTILNRNFFMAPGTNGAAMELVPLARLIFSSILGNKITLMILFEGHSRALSRDRRIKLPFYRYVEQIIKLADSSITVEDIYRSLLAKGA